MRISGAYSLISLRKVEALNINIPLFQK